MVEHVLWCAVAVVASVDAVLALSLAEWWLTKQEVKP